jgi:hypothetical protein
MSRQRLVFGAVLSASLAACGGSSSETPPPLEPDPHGFHYASPPPVATVESDAGDAPTIFPADDDAKARPQADPTWGVKKPALDPAPDPE